VKIHTSTPTDVPSARAEKLTVRINGLVFASKRPAVAVLERMVCQTSFVGNSKWKAVPPLLPSVTQIRP
jgi:hypothetical protein